MGTIKLLDCTLRDGGFVNDWNFGNGTMNSVFQRLVNANIEYIEIGFIDERRDEDLNHSINPSVASLSNAYLNSKKENSIVVAMIDYGTCNIENIKDCNNSFIDGIRIIFKKKDLDEALKFCEAVKSKGYKVFVQPVSVTTYTEDEMIHLIERVNEFNPFSMSIVDTYGLLHKDNLMKYFNLMNDKLNKNIEIGYHSHNNYQLSYANCIELTQIKTERNLIIDASVYGMGKGAGNANTELIALYLNEHFNKNYNIDQILEIIDVDIMKIFETTPWGYSLHFYLSASNNCHPNYVKYLRSKRTLSISSINDILKQIDDKSKLTYDENLITKLYLEYQNIEINDDSYKEMIKKDLINRDIVIMGPGKSIIDEKEKISKYINDHNSLVISINSVLENYDIDYIFVSNSKRYSQLANKFQQVKEENNKVKIIATSNISNINFDFDYVLNYSTLLDESNELNDNSLIMLLNFLSMIKVGKVSLCGFDGYSSDKNNYFDTFYDFARDQSAFVNNNERTKMALMEMDRKIDISFITRSLYEFEPKYNAIIFDVDGTLLDTSEGVLESLKYTTNQLRLPQLTKDELMKFIIPSVYESFKRIYGFNENEAKVATEIFRNNYKNYNLYKARVYDGIYDLLEYLRKKNIALGVATNKRSDYAKQILEKFMLDKYFDSIQGSDFENKLSKVDIIRKSLQDLNALNPNDIVMIGDTENDLNASKEVGLNFIGVSYGYGFNSNDLSTNENIVNNVSDLQKRLFI